MISLGETTGPYILREGELYAGDLGESKGHLEWLGESVGSPSPSVGQALRGLSRIFGLAAWRLG